MILICLGQKFLEVFDYLIHILVLDFLDSYGDIICTLLKLHADLAILPLERHLLLYKSTFNNRN